MSIERIIGALFSGFMCKAYCVAFAIWIAIETIRSFASTMTTIANHLQ